MVLIAFWNRAINPEKFELEVSRECLVDESLEKITKMPLVNSLDRLKLPLKLWFKGEPGIDVGGLTREYFGLITKELFKPSGVSKMFKHNEDV